MAAKKSANPRTKAVRKPRQPKLHLRPSATDFRAAARRLNALNGMKPRCRAPGLHLSSERELSEPQQAKRCALTPFHTPSLEPIRIPRSTKTDRRRRPVIEDSEDEDSLIPRFRWSSRNSRPGTTNIYLPNIDPTLRHTPSSGECIDGISDPNPNKPEVTDICSDSDDLEIDMHGWNALLHPGPSSQDQTQRYLTRGQRSKTANSRPHQPPAIAPLPTLGERDHEQRYSSITDNGSSSASITPVRQVYTTPKTRYTSEVKVALFLKSYDKRLDPKYNAIRDTGHRIHWGCDAALPSVEDAYAIQVRKEGRARRRYTEWGVEVALVGWNGMVKEIFPCRQTIRRI